MVELQFFYRKDTKQIDAIYRDCKSNSTVFKDTAVYAQVNVTDPPYEVTRDHKVVLDEAGNVLHTEPSLNPVQPTPTPIEVPTSIELKSPDGSIWTLSVDNIGKMGCKKKGM